MILAKLRVSEEEQDVKMSQLAWQTALLMTATGNYKKAIKPKDLYTQLSELKADADTVVTAESVNIEDLRNDLLSTFSKG